MYTSITFKAFLPVGSTLFILASLAGFASVQTSAIAGICYSVTEKAYPCSPRGTGEVLSRELSSPAIDAVKVAVFNDESIEVAQQLADVLNTDPEVQATAVSREMVESGGLAEFGCVATRLLGPPEEDRPTAATVQAIKDFVAGGGGYIGEWWGAGAALSGAAPSVNGDYFIPARFLGLFSGRASDGDFVETGNPITVIQDHPVVQGLPNLFAAGGGTEFFVRAVPPFDARLTILATYNGHGGTNPAIMVGQTGSSPAVLLFFDAIDEPGDVNLKQLWLNSVKFACVTSILKVPVDIKPGSFPNSINPKSNGVIPVAILTTDTFDATTVDPLSVRFGPKGAKEAHNKGHLKDVNQDRKLDLVLHFKTRATGIKCGDTSASLTGQTFDGDPIQGSDSIKTVGCK